MLYALILAGGAGTRFWPVSTKSRPKQFLSLDHDGKSLLKLTFERIKDTVPPQRIYVVTSAAQRDMTAKELPELILDNIIAEPVQRNTAAAIGYAVIRITRDDPQAGFLVLPSDHLIENKDVFVATMIAGAQVAAKTDSIVTFGIVPTSPSVGYGYIKKGAEHAEIGGVKVFDVEEFREKPDASAAKEYVDSGQYLWNSGMFVFKNTGFLTAMEKHLPKHYKALMKIQGSILSREEETVTIKEYYALEPISIDYGILEKTENIKMVESKFDWKDVGSWSSMEQVLGKDGDNNAAKGDNVVLDSKDNVIVSEGGVIAAVGVEGLVIIHTPKATLVCKKEDAEKVRDVVEKLKKKGLDQYL
jgi:mannose-1-phosphate guanylyltransferase